LQLGIDKGLYTHERLVIALSMLSAALHDVNEGSKYYGNYYQAMQKDFTRVTERGKAIVSGLHGYFEKKQKFPALEIPMPTVAA
jgi:hypothetical protein